MRFVFVQWLPPLLGKWDCHELNATFAHAFQLHSQKVKLCYVKNLLFVTFLYCIYTTLPATTRRADTNALRTVDGQIFHSSEFGKTRTELSDIFQTLNGLCFLGGLDKTLSLSVRGQRLRSLTARFKGSYANAFRFGFQLHDFCFGSSCCTSIHTFLFIFSVLLYVWALGFEVRFRS